jgi:serine/threonine protein kinase
VPPQTAEEKDNHDKFNIFLDFVGKLLTIDPKLRIKASQAINHEFIKMY